MSDERWCSVCFQPKAELGECLQCKTIMCRDCFEHHDPSSCTLTKEEIARLPKRLEVTAQCQSCGAQLTLPMPDAWDVPSDEHMAVDDQSEDDIQEFMEHMTGMSCPSCGGELKVALPPGEL